ncbi:MAG: ferrous iron transporter B [Candidatus Krumholzibacteriales bacterium]
MDKVLLLGNPNVGKSAIFSRLTGARVIASNYPGTTVEFVGGMLKAGEKELEVIDLPGTYTLDPSSEAEKVASRMLEDTFREDSGNSVVINIIDSTNLERNLNLTFQLIEKGVPMVIALNFCDEARHTGVSIDAEKLERIVGVPVVPTCGISGEGIKTLVDRLSEGRESRLDFERGHRWEKIGEVVESVQDLTHRHHSFLETLGDLTVKPLSGIPVALVILILVFEVIRLIGEGLITYLLDPIFERLWAPLMMKLSAVLGSGGIIHNILIGKLIQGEIDFGESFGILTTGLYVPLAAVLPYITAFYLVLSILEDTGYLPRLAVLVDNLMHRIGLHGFGVIPMFLSAGCNVPGALATRLMETRRERFLAMTLMAISIPCMAQTAMIMGLVGGEGVRGLLIVFGTLFLVGLSIGLIMNRFLKGRAPELFMEIPPYRFPYWRSLLKKLWMRVIWFLKEAVPWVLAGVFILNLLYTSGIISFIGNLLRPVITGMFGLPSDAAGALIIGFLRKDVAVGMLIPLQLSSKQLIISSVILTMYFPCAATFVVMLRELGVRDMIKSALIMVAATMTVGGIMNLIL